MSESQLIQVVPEPPDPDHWQPQAGPETIGLLSKLALDDGGRHRVLDGSVSIKANASAATERGMHNAGLVLAYVQRRETLSVTSVAALGRDNIYGLVMS